MVVVVSIYLISVQWRKYVLFIKINHSIFISDILFLIKIASEIGSKMNVLLMSKVESSRKKQVTWGHANERLLFDDNNFV